MGLADAALWGLTLRQFALLCDRHRMQERRADRRAGELLAMLYNINRDRTKDPSGADWLDFFPEWDEAAVQSDEQMYEAMLLWTRATAIAES